MSFPIFFRRRPVGTQYQIVAVMHDSSAPGVVMSFQNEVLHYQPEPADSALFEYQPPVLLSCGTQVLPSLAELRFDPAWEECKLTWDSAVSGGNLGIDGAAHAPDTDVETTNLYFV